MIVDLARGIPPFVMYCTYGESGSSLLIEYTDSMIFSPRMAPVNSLNSVYMHAGYYIGRLHIEL